LTVPSELANAVDHLDGAVGDTRERIAGLEADLDATRKSRERAVDELGLDDDGMPLLLGPLIWGLIGAVCALSAAFFAYLTVLMAGDSDMSISWIVTAILLAIGVASLGPSRKPGAGGSARRTLRFVTLVIAYVVPLVLAITPFLG